MTIMAQWKGKTRGGVFGYAIFIFIIKYLGLKPAYFVLRFVAFYFLFTSKTAVKSSFYLYKKRLGYSTLKSIWLIYQNYNSLGEVILDKIALLSGAFSGFHYNLEDEMHLRKMAGDKCGGILISAHFGNWEFASQLLSSIEVKVKIVMADAEHNKIKEQLNRALNKIQFNVIYIKEDMSHIYEINEALNNKEFICIHGDRFISKDQTFSLMFLGEEANFPSGVFSLPLIYNVPVSFVYAVKENNMEYHFFASAPKIYFKESSAKSRKELAKDIAIEYAANLEQMIKKYPSQWFNYFPFWAKD
jgi:predicted LPLAT superfamily acyltransferase